MDKADITGHIARNLKEERQKKGLSLQALSNLSGVSRSMLSQIERGESSPTVASLWNLTRALNIEIGDLIGDPSGGSSNIIAVVRAQDTPTIENKKAGCTIRILSALDGVDRVEVYDVVFKAGGALVSDPHKAGSVEHLTVLDGSVEVQSGGEAETLQSGDTLRYAADVPHAIRSKKASRVLLIVANI